MLETLSVTCVVKDSKMNQTSRDISIYFIKFQCKFNSVICWFYKIFKSLISVCSIQHMEEIKADSKITGRRKTTCFERSFSTWFNFFVCHVCKETCLSEDLLKNHMKLNHNVKNIICDMCDKRFRNKRGLLHMRKSHKNPIKRY